MDEEEITGPCEYCGRIRLCHRYGDSSHYGCRECIGKIKHKSKEESLHA